MGKYDAINLRRRGPQGIKEVKPRRCLGANCTKMIETTVHRRFCKECNAKRKTFTRGVNRVWGIGDSYET